MTLASMLAAAAFCAQMAHAAGQPPEKPAIGLLSLTGTASVCAKNAVHELKNGDAWPADASSSAQVKVLSGTLELSAGGLFRLRAGQGADYSAGLNGGALALNSSAESGPLQLTDSQGNVLVLQPGAALLAQVEKKKIRYEIRSGRALLTDTDGETHIIQAGKSREVDYDAPAQEAAGQTVSTDTVRAENIQTAQDQTPETEQEPEEQPDETFTGN